MSDMPQYIARFGKSFLLSICACALLLGGNSLSAAMVQYTTNGIFSNTGTNTETTGGVTLTLISATGLVNANPTTFAGFGNLVVTVAGGNPTPVTLPPGLTLTIRILQSLPSVGTSQLIGSLTGSISGNSSSATFTPSSASTTIGTITYAFTQNFYALVPPSSNNGDTSMQGTITAASIPEPASMVLLGAGLLGIGVASRKKFLTRA